MNDDKSYEIDREELENWLYDAIQIMSNAELVNLFNDMMSDTSIKYESDDTFIVMENK
jgi:hypothetical protein